MTISLRPYQVEIARAVLRSVERRDGHTITVEIARQGGKNELSAQLEVLLLTLNIYSGGNIVKASPTFKPQTVNSILRLRQRLDDWGYAGVYHTEMGYMVRLCEARAIFLSAEESANVVGNTAHLLLEIDEAQDVGLEKYTKDFRPMGASTNVTTVMWGTTWDDRTLLEQTKQTNLELERRDGVRRHFAYDWQAVAACNPLYGQYAESERVRLGEDHPLFRTQYRLLPVQGGGGFFTAMQRALVQGTHQRTRSPLPGRTYVAGIDIAGQAEADPELALVAARPRHDATVVTIGELQRAADRAGEPVTRIVEHMAWTGRPHTEAYGAMVETLRKWHPARVLVDATGLGEPVAAFLRKAIGPRVEPFKFTQASKSMLGFDLLAAVNRGGVQVYAGDGSAEFQEFMWEIERARSQFRPNQTINFYVDPAEGHDDYLMSLALCVEAAQTAKPATAAGGVRK